MATERSPAQAAATVLEAGNVAFFYRPMPEVAHPGSSDEIAHAYFVLFPDDQSHHQNRLFILVHGYFPPVIPGQDLPEERGWAYVTAVSHDPRGVIEALEHGPAAPPGERTQSCARVSGAGRYLIVRRADRTFLAYALNQPRQLGYAQQTLMLDSQASYLILVAEPYVPFELPLEGKPSYPAALAEKFDGHVSIPADPTDFLDYTWTRVLLIGAHTNPKTELGVAPDRRLQNEAEKQALQLLRDEAKRLQATCHVDVLKPLLDGDLV